MSRSCWETDGVPLCDCASHDMELKWLFTEDVLVWPWTSDWIVQYWEQHASYLGMRAMMGRSRRLTFSGSGNGDSLCWPFPSCGVHFRVGYRLCLRNSKKILNLLPMATALSVFKQQHSQKLNPSYPTWQSRVNRNSDNSPRLTTLWRWICRDRPLIMVAVRVLHTSLEVKSKQETEGRGEKGGKRVKKHRGHGWGGSTDEEECVLPAVIELALSSTRTTGPQGRLPTGSQRKQCMR